MKGLGLEKLHRPRSRSIYRGPLVLCPKGAYTLGAERGRYSVTMIEQDILYTQNLYGISFSNVDEIFAHVVSAILNSSIVTFQLAFGGPTWGLERPTVGPEDLLSLRMPRLDQCDSRLIKAVTRAEQNAAKEPGDARRLDALDDAVLDLYDLEQDERILVKDSVGRARYLVFEGRRERSASIVAPSRELLECYAGQVVSVLDAYLRARGQRHLEASIYSEKLHKADVESGLPGVTVVRFYMADGKPSSKPVVREGDQTELNALAELVKGRLENSIPPYLNERRQLRLYCNEDLFILKPTEVRYWTRTAALNDADIILADHWLRRRDAVAHA